MFLDLDFLQDAEISSIRPLHIFLLRMRETAVFPLPV